MKKKQIIESNKSSEKSDNESNDSDNDSECESELSSEYNGQEHIDPVEFFSVKELCYYKTIDKFFKTCSAENITKMIDIVEGKSNISLRILDWFVTKYSKKRIDCGSNKDTEIFDVRISYKSQLKSYKKRYFDPFRRRQKFVYYFDDKLQRHMDTTIGQLNFFKWAFTNSILTYVDKNLKHISKEMNLSNKEEKKKKKKKSEDESKSSSDEKRVSKTSTLKKKKHLKINDNSSDNLKINATKTMEDGEIKIVLKFD
jgi:hypothetical protein